MRSSSVVETNRPTPFVGLHLNYFCISPQPRMRSSLFSVFRLQFLLFNVPATISFRGKAATYSGIVGVSFHLNSTKQYFPGSNLLHSFINESLLDKGKQYLIFLGDAPFHKHSSLSPMFPMRRHACYLILLESITLMRDLSGRWYVRWKRLPSEGGGGPLWSSQCNLRLIDGNCHHFVQGWATLDWGTCTSRGKIAMHNAFV